MTIMMEFTRDEIQQQQQLPYALICTTRESAVWHTMHRRRRWQQEFTSKERAAAQRVFSKSRAWYLTSGVPQKVRLSKETYLLWLKLGDFCASL